MIKWRQDQENQAKEEELAIQFAIEDAKRERKHFTTYEERREHIRKQVKYRQATGGIMKEKEIVANEDPEFNIVIKGKRLLE